MFTKTRRYLLAVVALGFGLALAQTSAEGVVTMESNNDFETTQQRLEHAIAANNLILVTVIDHAANAESAGLELPPTRLLIFGNPQVGTPLMQQSRTHAIDLPQKMLVWQDSGGAIYVSYNEPGYLARRHGLMADTRTETIAGVLNSLASVATNNEPLEDSSNGDSDD
ncbi:MAG: DUF302 domain-containing protein [Trueperaceae bacterium]|nr:DUF302 domain-containing protein [Trueperaceae bacterium]